MKLSKSIICALVAGVIVGAESASGETVHLSVSYCPTAFTGRGGVVSVDPSGAGSFSVVDHGWKWPSAVDSGCPENSDPTVLIDAGHAYLDFTSAWGYITDIDVTKGSVARAIKASSRTDLAFDGFTSFATSDSGNSFVGITPQATQKGFCSNGCFQYGTQNATSGVFTGAAYVPFKAAMTNVAYLDADEGVYYIQASYPLEASAYCTAEETDQCMVGLDATTGDIVSNKLANNAEVYMWAPQTKDTSGSILAWVNGFDSECKHPYNDFAFARINPKTAESTLVACIPKSVTVHTNPNIAAFNADASLFATSSGNSETGEVQLLVFNTATGEVVLETALPGLKKALGVGSVAPFINVWGVSWA